MAQGMAETNEDKVNSNVQVRKNFREQYFLGKSGWLINKLVAPKNKYEGQTPNKSSFM